ncbi:hypothetical protein ABN028_19955 [Actinopolymorpha sp. B17G11]|uniref:hypothetical protein n=1 Tax=Actinopolymorpha sp. B17G11 TaxID=3160861 RepID=UPI0032E49F20
MPNPIPAQRTTRKPTGKPPWPFVILAGKEKSGKTWLLAEFTGASYLGRKFWFELGEDGEADRYGALPEADFEIVEHNGSYRDLLDGLRWAVAQPRETGKPNLIIFDSATILWDLLTDEQQALSNRRAKFRASKGRGQFDPDKAYTITSEQWNAAKKRWKDVIDLFKRHDGPVVATTRFEKVMVVDDGGNPTKDTQWKVKAEKNLPYEGDVIVEMPEFRMAYITGARSVPPIPDMKPGEHKHIPDFTLDGLMRLLNVVGEGQTQPRAIVRPNAAAYLDEYDEEMRRAAEAEEARESFENAEPRPAAPANRHLPDAAIVGQEINAAYGWNGAPDEKRQKLKEVANRYGRSILDLTPYTSPQGAQMTASEAVDKLLAIVAALEAEATKPADAQPEEPTPAESEPAEWPEVAKPPTDPHPAKVAEDARQERYAANSPKEKQLALLVAELDFQAEVFKETRDTWLMELLAQERKESPRDIPLEALKTYIREKRALVIDALRDAGRATVADRYAGEGTKAPINVAAMLRDAEEEGAHEPQAQAANAG